jgi:hypothetical protein
MGFQMRYIGDCAEYFMRFFAISDEDGISTTRIAYPRISIAPTHR